MHARTLFILYMKIGLLEIAGFYSAFRAIHLPLGKPSQVEVSLRTNNWHRGETSAIVETGTRVHIPDHDLKLAKKLIKTGDAHAKAIRGIVVWLEISAPMYWWAELEIHRAGHERLSSSSTMHIDCKGLTGEELVKAKEEMPAGKILTKVDYFSYQALRNMWLLRKYHRLPQWHQLFDFIRANCPLADELIFVDYDRRSPEENRS